MGGLSLAHWVVIAAILILLFGGPRIANLLSDTGKGIREFRKSIKEEKNE